MLWYEGMLILVWYSMIMCWLLNVKINIAICWHQLACHRLVPSGTACFKCQLAPWHLILHEVIRILNPNMKRHGTSYFLFILNPNLV